MLIALTLLLVANALITGRTKELNAGRSRENAMVIDLSCFRDMRFVWATLGIAMFEFVVAAASSASPSVPRFWTRSARASLPSSSVSSCSWPWRRSPRAGGRACAIGGSGRLSFNSFWL
ncbi:hypothetical protein QBC46DRAFT_374282 [Diplogelasinospora grovesii]|uniref:Uncharacterized protein n=1 Tax=Diplogelasinospora grovesii TaxID=303347 RepID=A0AAN6NG02_9PEZI|nr:hypothetical protein QBC46DRAFT_374282 [Diplogelasinospora grovesii]